MSTSVRRCRRSRRSRLPSSQICCTVVAADLFGDPLFCFSGTSPLLSGPLIWSHRRQCAVHLVFAVIVPSAAIVQPSECPPRRRSIQCAVHLVVAAIVPSAAIVHPSVARTRTRGRVSIIYWCQCRSNSARTSLQLLVSRFSINIICSMCCCCAYWAIFPVRPPLLSTFSFLLACFSLTTQASVRTTERTRSLVAVNPSISRHRPSIINHHYTVPSNNSADPKQSQSIATALLSRRPLSRPVLRPGLSSIIGAIQYPILFANCRSCHHSPELLKVIHPALAQTRRVAVIGPRSSLISIRLLLHVLQDICARPSAAATPEPGTRYRFRLPIRSNYCFTRRPTVSTSLLALSLFIDMVSF